MISIYGYVDFTEYLRDDFRQRKNRNRKYSYRAMAERLELSSSTVVRIMNGKRGLSRSMIPRFVSYLDLSQKEADYFRSMVVFKTAKSEQTRMEAYRSMTSLRGGRTITVSQKQHSFYEKWYYSAIRELLRIEKFTGDYKKLAGKLEPPIGESQARKAVDILRSLGLIRCDGDSYCVTDKNISTGEIWQDAAIHTFQHAISQKATEALNGIPRQERDFSTMTMCYSRQGFQKVRELLKRTREELSRIEESDHDHERVYQINLQLFPLSKPCGGGGE